MLLSCCLVPSLEEYRIQAEQVLGCQIPTPHFALVKNLRICFRVFKVRWVDHSFFCMSALSILCFWQYFQGVASPFLVAFLGSKDAAAEINGVGTALYGILGLFLAPVGGYVADRFGFSCLAGFVTLLIVLMAPPLFVPNVPAQLLSTTLYQILSVLQNTYLIRWFTIYAPPHHFGTFQGAIFSGCGILSFLICSLLQVISESYLVDIARFLVSLSILTAGNVISACAFYWHIRKLQLPSTPPVVDEEVEDNRQGDPSYQAVAVSA
eukprot:gnl/TRDRNA2_/TRDRNA2_205317_c0_seq1.p1 gnl/TRDRNA2_/TRDRNA2_205317_c0~~gnl/TRDRNA2_/TRDRNA2_205317_c0_seq1.p1  ORF type:complete len:266 (-),score=8.36 gnl/TRDRNA2_/TRDRNA2_205317_c0_seq1:103-900(-)